MKFYLAMILFLSTACGTDTRTYGDQPGGGRLPPGGGGQPPAGDLSYGQMNALLQNYCAKCHSTAGFMQSESALRQSRAKNWIFNEDMPPSGAKVLPDTERELMLSFF